MKKSSKTLTVLALSAATVISSAAVSAAAATFTDVPETHWA